MEGLHSALSLVFGLSTGICIGLAFTINPLVAGVAVAGIAYNVTRTYLGK